MRWNYARALYEDVGATLDDLREAVATLEDTERTARRVLGGAHPDTQVSIEIEDILQSAAKRASRAPRPRGADRRPRKLGSVACKPPQ